MKYGYTRKKGKRTPDMIRSHFACARRCLSNFVHDRQLETEILPLGFTFSFPLEQQGLAQAVLVKWTKGFNCEGVEGTDVVRHLQVPVSGTNGT
jgi:hexokinase